MMTRSAAGESNTPEPRAALPRRLRIVRSADFERILKDGARLTDARLIVWAWPNGLDVPRLGLIVGRKHGHAVRRNRIKRVLREAFRLSQHELPAGLDLVCAPRTGPEIELRECQPALVRLAWRLARRLDLE
jgi:ribonuclease P protein component